MQIALSVVLLVGAGLLVRAFVEAQRIDAGFEANRHFTFRLALPGSRWRSGCGRGGAPWGSDSFSVRHHRTAPRQSTCIGVYGVLAYAVAFRRHEFGVRRALGADRSQVMREVLREGLGFTLAGCAAGLLGAVFAARLLQSQLYGVHPRDPLAYGVSLALILAGAVLACWIPGRRATAISPMAALRVE